MSGTAKLHVKGQQGLRPVTQSASCSVCSQLDKNWRWMQMPGTSHHQSQLERRRLFLSIFSFPFEDEGDGKKVKFWKWKSYLNEAVLNDTFSQKEQINHLKPNLLHKLRISLATKYAAVSKKKKTDFCKYHKQYWYLSYFFHLYIQWC